MAERNIEVLKAKGLNTKNLKEFYEANNLFEQGKLYQSKGKWEEANNYFIMSIKKAEDAENKNINN